MARRVVNNVNKKKRECTFTRQSSRALRGVGLLFGARAQRGASLPLALFLFMICALLASVVLAASTTAVGSYNGLAKADQRYYSVSSAANLFRDKLNGDVVKLVVEKTEKADGSSGTTVTFNSEDTKYNVSGTPTSVPTNGHSLSELAAFYLLLGGNQYSSEKVQSIPNSMGSSPSLNLDFQVDGAPTGSALNVIVKPKVSESGLTLEIESPHGGEKDYYSIALGFDADVQEIESVKTTRDNGTETKVTTKTYEVKWMASDLTEAGV